MATASGFVLGLSVCLGIVLGQQPLTVKPHRVTEIPAAIVDYHIKDELQADTIIGTIPTDSSLDLRYNHEVLNQLRYSFLDENPYLHLQEDTGVIRTVQMIDRDQVCSEMSSCYMQLHVLVQPIFQIITVKVEVIDINDNVPVFPVNEVSYIIAESASLGTTIKIPSAQDQDSSEYRIKWYELLPTTQDAFALKSTRLLDGSTHLQLVLLKTLDPEKQDSYQLEVVASDGGDPPKSGSLIINIKVNRAAGNSTMPESDKNDFLEGTATSPLPIDSSDHDLRFEKESYDLDIHEDTIGIIANVSILGDYPEGQITYLFERLTSYFEIDPDTGTIYLSYHLDYEKASSYELAVVAALNTSGTLTLAHTSVSIHVIDVNDNSPWISLPNLYGSYGKVYENEMIGMIIEDVMVTDHDSEENGKVECSVNSTDFKLEKISDTEYKLVTAVTLDRESKDNHTLQISCEDSGDVPRKTDRIIHVRVLDRNDNAPQFTSALYYAEINDINQIGFFEFSVRADDPDDAYNGKILYHIDGENERETFQIDEEYGVIRPYIKEDYFGYSYQIRYEDLSTMILPIIASDRGNPALSSTASVYISVHNDPPPVFRQEHYSFSIYENQMTGSLVGIVTAYVRDFPPHRKVEYKLDDEHASNSFAINPNTGEITTVKPLDREAAHYYSFHVMAVNEAHGTMQNTSAKVSVYVEDENDNIPVLDFPTETNNSITIESSVPFGAEVFQILAHDDDEDENADLIYSFAEKFDLFKVDSVTGTVYTTPYFSSSLKNTAHHVIIKVADKGQPSRVTLGEVTINIT